MGNKNGNYWVSNLNDNKRKHLWFNAKVIYSKKSFGKNLWIILHQPIIT